MKMDERRREEERVWRKRKEKSGDADVKSEKGHE